MRRLKRYSRIAAFFMAALLLLTLGVLADSPQTVEADSAEVLLVCDVQNGRAALEALIRANGKTVHSVSEADYTSDLPQRYSFVVTTINQPYRDAVAAKIPTVCVGPDAGPIEGVTTLALKNFSATLQLGDHSQYQFINAATLARQTENSRPYGNILLSTGESFPFGIICANVAYAPWYQEQGLSYIMLGGLLRDYFGDAATTGDMYVLLDEIYPFSDLEMLRTTADRFAQSGIPFIVRVMPVYDNLDYPAFKRFTQALRYVQTKGGSIVLHDPIVRQYETERTPLAEKLARANAALTKEGIVLYNLDKPGVEISLETLQSISHTGLHFGGLPVNTMIRFSLFETQAALADTVQGLDDAWLSLSNYKTRFPQLEAPQFQEKAIETAYVYREGIPTSLNGFFSGTNRVLLILVGISVVVFLILIALGRRLYRQMFYRRS